MNDRPAPNRRTFIGTAGAVAASVAFQSRRDYCFSAYIASTALVANLRTQTTGTPTFGPYLQQAPVNPLNSSTGVGVVSGTTDFGAGGGANPGGSVGYLLNTTTGKVWATSSKFGYVYNEANPSDANNDN